MGEGTAAAVAAGLEAYSGRESGVVEVAGEAVFVQVFPRRDQLLVIGAGHITLPLVQFAALLDFETAVIDPREVFATPERFPVQPSQLLAEWPGDLLDGWDLNEDCYCAVLTHDPKIDDEALHRFLKAPVAYIGALGGRKSHARRRARLQEAGFPRRRSTASRGRSGSTSAPRRRRKSPSAFWPRWWRSSARGRHADWGPVPAAEAGFSAAPPAR